jgi:aminoglycoside 6'-N-acetyltransferase
VRPWWGDYDEAKLSEEVADPSHTVWTIEVEGEPAGLLEVTEESDPDYRNVALDIFIGAQHHGKGLGAEALRTMLRHLFEERGHHRATIDPAVENDRAIRSYERVGFKPVGVLRKADRAPDGRWRDALMMDLLAEELR